MDTAERVARQSYGRLLASLSGRWRDIAAAEDALSDAFVAALRWPVDGVPRNPEGWLLAAARRRLIDASRRARTRQDAEQELRLLATERADGARAPDDRLGLLFACAHPAIDPAVRTPLMLQTVLGVDAARIAGAVGAAPKTLGQRLWRAKNKICDAGIPFEVPEASELPDRSFRCRSRTPIGGVRSRSPRPSVPCSQQRVRVVRVRIRSKLPFNRPTSTAAGRVGRTRRPSRACTRCWCSSRPPSARAWPMPRPSGPPGTRYGASTSSTRDWLSAHGR